MRLSNGVSFSACKNNLKSATFWDVMPYNLVEDYRGFGETYCFVFIDMVLRTSTLIYKKAV
jgi:hypothetical protein